MNIGFLDEDLIIPVRFETAAGANITGATASDISVFFAYQSGTVWQENQTTGLTSTTHYTLQEIADGKGQYNLTIKKSQITKAENWQCIVDPDDDPTIVTKRYSGTTRLKFKSGKIFANFVTGTAGTAYPLGEADTPTKNVRDAIIIGNDNKGISQIVIQNKLHTMSAVGSQGAFKTIVGTGASEVDADGNSFTDLTMKNLIVKGAGVSGQERNTYIECIFEIIGLLGVNTHLLKCTIDSSGDILPKDLTDFFLCEILSPLDFASLGTGAVKITKCSGKATIKNVTTAGTVNIRDFVGDLTVEASCTTVGGIILTGFKGKLTNNAAAGVVVVVKDDLIEETVSRSANGALTGGPHTASLIRTNLTEVTDNHFNDSVIKFTSGVLLGQSRFIKDYIGATKDIVPGVPFTDIPADNDTFDIIPVVDSVTATTTGVAFSNQRREKTVYDAFGNPTSYELRIFANATDAQANTNPVQRFSVTTTYARDTINQNRFQITSTLMKEL